MSNIKLITVCSHPENAGTLIASAKKFGWDLVVLQHSWLGFGTKIIETCNYLIDNPEVKRFVFCDAFDVVVLGTPEEFEEKVKLYDCDFVFSSERGCWPKPEYKSGYTEHPHRFNYLNSGLYYVSDSLNYIQMIKNTPLTYATDDQLYFTERYFDGNGIMLDNFQRVFNSHSFIDDGEYTYENGRVQILGNEPIFIHSNARTADEKLDQLVKEILAWKI